MRKYIRFYRAQILERIVFSLIVIAIMLLFFLAHIFA